MVATVEEVVDTTANVASLARVFDARSRHVRPTARDTAAAQHTRGPASSLRNRIGFFDARDRVPAREPDVVGRPPNPMVVVTPPTESTTTTPDLKSRIRTYETCVTAAPRPTVQRCPPRSFDGVPSVRALTLAFQAAVTRPNPETGLERPTRRTNFDAAVRYNRALDAACDGSTVQVATARERPRIEAGSVKKMIGIFEN